MAQDSIERDKEQRRKDKKEGRNGRLVLDAAEDADDGTGVESGDGDAGGGEEENEADVLDEKVAVFVVGIGSVVGKSGKHNVDDAVNGHDEHVLDFGNELVNANNAVWCKKSEKNHVGLRIHAGGDAGDKEGPHGFEVSTYVEFLPRSELDELAKTDHIENIGSVSSEDNYGPVDAIVVRITNEKEHEDKADEFDSDTANGDVSILLNGLVEPFNTEAGEP